MKYYTVNDVAEKYKVSKQAVHKWIKNGKLKAVRIAGTTLRIEESEVENLKKEVG